MSNILFFLDDLIFLTLHEMHFLKSFQNAPVGGLSIYFYFELLK